jgi:hypothetical protein
MRLQDEAKPEVESWIAAQDARTLETYAHENVDACARGEALDTREAVDAFTSDVTQARLAWAWAVVWFLEWVRR